MCTSRHVLRSRQIKIRFDPNAVGPFVAAASPGTILGLLDEIDRLRSSGLDLLDEIERLRDRVAGQEAARRVCERERESWESAYQRVAAQIPRKTDDTSTP